MNNLQALRAALIAGGFVLIAAALNMWSQHVQGGMSQAVGVVALLLVLWGLVTGHHEYGRQHRANYMNWDRRSAFQLWEAAGLWAGEEPKMPLSKAAARQFRKLEAGARDKTLAFTHHDRRDVINWVIDQRRGRTRAMTDPTWEVTREKLIAFAIVSDEKPPFLFPKER